MCVFIALCVCACVYAHAWMCMLMWKSEFGVGCLPPPLSTLRFQAVSHWTYTHQLAGLTGQWAPGSPHLPGLRLLMHAVSHAQLLNWGWRPSCFHRRLKVKSLAHRLDDLSVLTWNPRGRRREPALAGCPLTSICTLWHVCTDINMCTRAYSLNKIK